MAMAELGKADWLYDAERGVHLAVCSRPGQYGHRCGEVLELSEIPAGDCGRHDVVSALARRRARAAIERLGRIVE